MKKKSLIAAILSAMILFALPAFAAHPLITDDPDTQGKGKFQLEVNGESGFDKETVDGAAIKTRGSELATSLSYGVTKEVDLIVGVPYQNYSVKADGATMAKENGLSDVAIEVKWRFFEKDGFALGFKPGVILPTGDENKGLGAGKTGYSACFIASKELEPLTFLVNLGYVRNENKADERKDLLHLSAAAVYKATEQLKLVANIGQETNTDKVSNTAPAFALAGAIYAFTDSFEVDFGIKAGRNDPETDMTYLAGAVFRF